METSQTRIRRDFLAIFYALGLSLMLAALVGAGAFFWNELEQAKADNAALANQVRSLGGQPVAEGKPGDQGPPGPAGPRGPQGPPGAQGKQGPIGVTGQSPQCLLEPSRCVGPAGPKGATGGKGLDGTDGQQGEQGPAGEKGDQGPAGSQGEPGTDGAKGDPGEQGEVGPQGEPGRGITSTKCQGDGTWLFMYSDGSSETVDGPCRVLPNPAGTGN